MYLPQQGTARQVTTLTGWDIQHRALSVALVTDCDGRVGGALYPGPVFDRSREGRCVVCCAHLKRMSEVVSAQRPSARMRLTAPMWWMPVEKGAAIEGAASTAAWWDGKEGWGVGRRG
jgi:hypothetical protein